MDAALVAQARVWLRRSTDALDAEIEQTLEAGELDLRGSGVSNVDTNDALIRQALKLYCKANVGYGDEEGKFAKAYEYLKKSLALNSDYQEPGS